jgi:hypothetical protein
MADANPLSQIGALSMTLECQQKQLDSLKGVPELLKEVAEHFNLGRDKNKDSWSLGLSEDEDETNVQQKESDEFAALFQNENNGKIYYIYQCNKISIEIKLLIDFI